MWREAGGQPFNPGNYYYVGGNSKLYGAVLIRYRQEDFSEMEHFGGVSPAWPFPYEELEPWYSAAEQLFKVRGALGEDPTEPFHSKPYAVPAGAGRSADRAGARRAERARPASVVAAARRRHRALAGRRTHAVGRLPQHRRRQDGRRKRLACRGAAGPEHPARHRRDGRAARSFGRRQDASARSTTARTARRRRCRRSSSSSAPAPSIRRPSCCARRRAAWPIRPTRSAATS